MGGAAGSISVIFEKSPDRATTLSLLHRISTSKLSLTPQEVDKPLILYGAGNLGKMARDYFCHVDIPFSYVVDTNPAAFRNDPDWQGIAVIGSDEVPETYKKKSLLAVCISTVPYVPIYQSLITQGWEHIVPFYDIAEFYRNRHPLSNGWFVGSLSEEDILGIERVLDRWEDDISRAHHLQFLAWRCLREEWVFDGAPVTTNDRYFIPQVTSILHQQESFLDVGAHHGEVSIKFSEVVRGDFHEILAIEPDQYNLTALNENFAKEFPEYLRQRIRVLENVIAESTSFGCFIEGLGYASQLSSLGRGVPFVTIDSLKVAPTYLKVHIEGGELDALKGAITTIKTCRPIIAATVYHNRLGLWKTPLWLMNSLENYQILLRLHGWCGTGLVLYAIPKERYNK